MIFKRVREGRPYPAHRFSAGDWAKIPPHLVRLDQLVTTKRELGLDNLLAEDSTFYGDLFPHAVQWRGELYLEDGLHRCLRAALQQRTSIHVRVLNLDKLGASNVDAVGGPHHTNDEPAPNGTALDLSAKDGPAATGLAGPTDGSTGPTDGGTGPDDEPETGPIAG